jgi:hypothetical protein
VPATERFKLDGITFLMDKRPGPERYQSKPDRFVLVKTRRMLTFYESLQVQAPKSILEIGMFEGGSLVYFDKLFAPEMLVGIDARQTPIEALELYKQDKPYIRTYYGRWQDRPGTRGAAQANFPHGIDLVVDDASHMYETTKRTFENLFPFVKPGGLYVIENWAWSHRPSRQSSADPWYGEPALTNFVFDVSMLTAVSSVIESLTISADVLCVRKGKGALPIQKLDLSGYLRGREPPRI